MLNQFVFVSLVALLVAALVIGLAVLRDIFFEGVERYRHGPPERTTETDPGGVVCDACGATNDEDFEYCQQCATRL